MSVHWWPGGCGIATTLPLEPVEFGLSRRTAAAVKVQTDYLVVVSAHLKCCGHSGSEEDEHRVAQARELVDRIQRLRRGQYGERYKDAAVVVVGDYSLVGSRQPLDIIKTTGLTDWLLQRVGDRAAVTWRDDDSEFWPGRLDLLAYDPERLKKRNGCVLDTALLTPEELAGLGLRADDSSVSDHLMLVADFQLGR